MENKKRILLVEDDDFLAKMYKQKFKLEGFDVLYASNGEDGLTMVRNEHPDLVLLDVIMPKMNGWQFLEKMRNELADYSPPVILLTNLGQNSDVKKGMSLGVVDYLIKAHFTPSEVVNKIKEVLNTQKNN